MIRIHSGTELCYPTILRGSTWGSDWSLDWVLIPAVSDHHAQEEFRSFDYLEPDIFGDDISYNFGSPVSHHWTSIRNFQCKGDLYCYDFTPTMSRQSWYKDHPDLRTGHLPPRFVVDFFGNKGIVCDKAKYRPEKATRHEMCCNYKYSRLRGLGIGFVFGHAVYQVNGQPSFSPYKLQTYKTYSQNFIFIEWLGRDQFKLKNESITVLIRAADSYQKWAAELFEVAELRNPSVIDRPITRGSKLRALPKPTLHAPNYGALFPEKGRNPNWAELASSAYSTLAFSDINGMAFVKDSLEMGGQFNSFVKTLRSLPFKRAAAAASAWLAIHYGFKLALLDTLHLRDELKAQSLRNTRKSKCQAGTTYRHGRASYTARYQVFYNEFDSIISAIDQALYISDFRLTTENIWDMIPYSFIVDWFIGIGDLLSALDGYQSLSQDHKVVAAGKSIKGTVTAIPSMLGLDESYNCGSIQITSFFRRYSQVLQSPSFFPSVTVNPFNHLVEGAALVISRK